MSEKRILLASLLKPVNDTRMYEKLGLSLSSLPGTEIHICGFETPIPAAAPANILFHPLFSFSRLSMGRLKAQLTFYKFLKELKPQVVIVCTHELLLPSYIYCRRHKTKLLYDVQENYALNLLKQQNYAPLVKRLLAWGVRSVEHLVSQSIAHFILAERSYAEELTFIKNRYTILENKYRRSATYASPAIPVLLKEEPLRLLYSGTIAKAYGIFEAIELAEKLYAVDSSTTLTIIGYSARQDTLYEVYQRIRAKSYIRLVGGEKLVPHQQIIEEINKSNVGLLPYRPNDSTFRCIPTKLYEYMAHALPIVVQQNPLWHSIVWQKHAGLSIDFMNIDEQELLNRLRSTIFYTLGVSKDIFWKKEEEKLLKLFNEKIKATQ